jgi:predicted site-specific integrase-resolvase
MIRIACTGQPEDGSWEQDLVRDVLAIVTSFAGRLHGQRSDKVRKLRAVVAAEARSSAA